MKKLILFLWALMAAFGAAAADASANYTVDGLQISRSLHVDQIGHIDPSTGAASSPWYQSTVTLSVRNVGRSVKSGLMVQEDLSYLPANARLDYSVPPSSAGRQAAWSVSTLPSGSEFRVTITLMALVPDSAIGAQGAPAIEYARLPAQLYSPSFVDVGHAVQMRLTDSSHAPIDGAEIEVSAPDGRIRVLSTDETGSARFTADSEGIYTYRVPSYSVQFIQPTQSVQPQAAAPPTAGAMVSPPSGPQARSDDGAMVWVIVGGGLMAGFAALALFGFLSRSQIQQEPGASDRPSRARIEEDMGLQLKEGRAGAGMRGTPQSPGAAPDALAQRQILETAPPQEEGAPDEESWSEKTQGMLKRRRAEPPAHSDEEAGAPPGPQAPDEAQEKPPLPSEFTESTQVDEAGAPQRPQADETGGRIPIPSNLVAQFAAATGEQEGGGPKSGDESDEIDDEAIRKTIEELEQLREQLQARDGQKPQTDEEESENTQTVPKQKHEDADEKKEEGLDGQTLQDGEGNEEEGPDDAPKEPEVIDLGKLEREEEEELAQEGITLLEEERKEDEDGGEDEGAPAAHPYARKIVPLRKLEARPQPARKKREKPPKGTPKKPAQKSSPAKKRSMASEKIAKPLLKAGRPPKGPAAAAIKEKSAKHSQTGAKKAGAQKKPAERARKAGRK